MATNYYVKTPANGGSDSNNGLTPSTAFATNVKAYSVCTGGEDVTVFPGNYAENSGSGFWSLARAMSSTVTFHSSTGNAADVVITGTSGTSEVIVTSATNTTFQNMTFTSRSSSTVFVIRWNPGTSSTIKFPGCVITVITSPSQINTAVKSQFGGVAHNTQNIDFSTTTINYSGSDPADGINFTETTVGGVLDTIVVNNATVNATRHAVALIGVTNASVQGSGISSDSNNVSGSSAGTAMQLGVDGNTGFNSTGTISGSIITATYGHACLVGAGVSAATLNSLRIYGGNTGGSGQGLVLKECSGVDAQDIVLYSGAINGLYFKGAHTNRVRRITVINFSFANSYCLHMGWGDTGDQAYDNDVQNCRFITNIGAMVYWGGLNELRVNNICDNNVYELSGTGNWGDWQNSGTGNNISSFADLQSKQNSYLVGNDSHSMAVGSAPVTSYSHTATAARLYRIIKDTKGNYWDGANFVPALPSTRYKYAKFMVENQPSSYDYSAVVYTALPAGDYYVSIHVQSGNAPSVTDPVLIQNMPMSWSGTAIIGLASIVLQRFGFTVRAGSNIQRNAGLSANAQKNLALSADAGACA